MINNSSRSAYTKMFRLFKLQKHHNTNSCYNGIPVDDRDDDKSQNNNDDGTIMTRNQVSDINKWGDDNYCEKRCYQAYVACLEAIHDHINEYIQKNITNVDEIKRERNGIIPNNSMNDSNELKKQCSYEDWIRECHPENTHMTDIDEKYHGVQIDNRFYLNDSDHLIIWNKTMYALGHPDLKVIPKNKRKKSILKSTYLQALVDQRLGIEQQQ